MTATGHSSMHITKAWKHCWSDWSHSACSLVSPSTPKTCINGLMCYCLIKWLNILYVKDNLLSGRFWHASPWKHIKSSYHQKRKEMREPTFCSTQNESDQKCQWQYQWEHKNMNFVSSLSQKGMRKQNRRKTGIICKAGGKCLPNLLHAVPKMSCRNTCQHQGRT